MPYSRERIVVCSSAVELAPSEHTTSRQDFCIKLSKLFVLQFGSGLCRNGILANHTVHHSQFASMTVNWIADKSRLIWQCSASKCSARLPICDGVVRLKRVAS